MEVETVVPPIGTTAREAAIKAAKIMRARAIDNYPAIIGENPLFSQFAFQNLNINASARTAGRQFAIDHDCRNGSNAKPLGAREDAGVHHILHDDFGRRPDLSPHYVNCLLAERASRAEYFHLALAGHSTLLIRGFG
jgi:hypothetical protein